MQSNESLIWFSELYHDARAVFKSNSINEFRLFPLFDNSIDVSRDRVQKSIWSMYYYVSVDGAVSSRCEIKPFIHSEMYFSLFWRRRWRQWIPGVAFFCWAIDFIQTIELFKGYSQTAMSCMHKWNLVMVNDIFEHRVSWLCFRSVLMCRFCAFMHVVFSCSMSKQNNNCKWYDRVGATWMWVNAFHVNYKWVSN